MIKAKSWELTLGAKTRVAVASRHVVEFIRSPKLVPVPLAPIHSAGLLVWQGNIIPAVNLGQALGVGESGGSPEYVSGMVVLAYQDAPGTPMRHGGLTVCAVPEEVWVTDDMSCPLPAHPGGIWDLLALSCFAKDDHVIPILDVARLFSAALTARCRNVNAKPRKAALSASAGSGSEADVTIESEGPDGTDRSQGYLGTEVDGEGEWRVRVK